MKQSSVRLNDEFLNDSKSISKQVNDALKFAKLVEEVLNDNYSNNIKVEKIKMLYESIIKH